MNLLFVQQLSRLLYYLHTRMVPYYQQGKDLILKASVADGEEGGRGGRGVGGGSVVPIGTYRNRALRAWKFRSN